MIAEKVNDILLLLYDMSIANAPMPPGDCRDIAEKVAAHVGTVRRLIGLPEGDAVRDKEVTELGGSLLGIDITADTKSLHPTTEYYIAHPERDNRVAAPGRLNEDD